MANARWFAVNIAVLLSLFTLWSEYTHGQTYSSFPHAFLNFVSTNASRSLPHRGNPQKAPLTPQCLEVSLLFNTSLINFVQAE